MRPQAYFSKAFLLKIKFFSINLYPGGFMHQIGVDEAGRGCLAGSVYAGAVILNSTQTHFHDSKTLSDLRRLELYEEIKSEHQWGVGFASIEEIAELNILHAARLAMRRAVEALKVQPENHEVWIDGPYDIPGLVGYKQYPLVKGDQKMSVIGAASILAKVSRDLYCEKLHEKYPVYNFKQHKAYGTKAHLQAIKDYGPCAEHRRGFKGVREFITRPSL